MTVVVAFLCTDGAVVATDSMITSSMGGLNIAHHNGRKVSVIPGNQVYAWAGNQGQAARFGIIANASHANILTAQHAFDYPLSLTTAVIAQFNQTGVGNAFDLVPVLAFAHGGNPQCCVFEGVLQPRLLDEHHFYFAAGSGKLAADPFLRFLVDVFCQNGRPTVREAVFLATWVVEHVIRTNPGGVAAPIRMAVIETDAAGALTAKDVPDEEIEEHRQAIESAEAALRSWRDNLQSGAAAEDVPEPPAAPAAAPKLERHLKQAVGPQS